MHCHVGFCSDPASAARALEREDVSAFSCSVTPSEYARVKQLLADQANIRVALGLHPWWVQKARAAAPGDDTGASLVDEFVSLLKEERFIGEVGLDLSPRHAEWLTQQQAVFRRIVRGCAVSGNKVFSIHAVRSASMILDELNEAGIFRVDSSSVCVFHWFSGTPSELKFAQEAGCYFSINPHMLESKRGRFYAQNIPLGQLLLETDAPAAEGDELDAVDIRRRLERSLETLAELRKVEVAELSETIAATSKALLGM